MFRQTPFTKSDLARSIVARETPTKVRYFDPETARWSGWMPKVNPARKAAQFSASLTFTADPAEVSAFQKALYGAMKIDQLRKFASESGVKNASRMRKADILAALTQTVTA